MPFFMTRFSLLVSDKELFDRPAAIFPGQWLPGAGYKYGRSEQMAVYCNKIVIIL
jgi:hypothetical protein